MTAKLAVNWLSDMAGRPPLRIGQHGKITRKYLGGGVWLARARFRDPDGVTRIVERRGPADEQDAHGKLAEDALVDALNQRRTAGDSEITLDSRIIALEHHESSKSTRTNPLRIVLLHSARYQSGSA